MLKVYKELNFCPLCGREFTIFPTGIDDIRLCRNHPDFDVMPRVNNEGTEIIMVLASK